MVTFDSNEIEGWKFEEGLLEWEYLLMNENLNNLNILQNFFFLKQLIKIMWKETRS